MFVLRPFCITHSFVVAGENAPCGARRTRTRAGNVHSLTGEPKSCGLLCTAFINPFSLVPSHRNNESRLAIEDKAPRRKCSQFLELIGSAAVAVPADYTRYMNRPLIWGKWEKLSSTAGSPSRPRPTSRWPRSMFRRNRDDSYRHRRGNRQRPNRW
jgi:hypothetical protein